MFGTNAHTHDTPATVDRLVQGFSECRAKLRLLEQSEEQLERSVAVTCIDDSQAAIEWHGADAKRMSGDVSEKAMQHQAQFDTPPPRFDETSLLAAAPSAPHHQDTLRDQDFPLHMLRHLGPDMACLLDGALQRQREMVDAAHHALDGLGEANRALIADLAESRANESNLTVAIDDLHAVHRAAEASQAQELTSLYAAQSAAQHELASLRRLAAADRDQLNRLHDVTEDLQAEMSRLCADSAALHAHNTSLQSTITDHRMTESMLQEEIERLTAAKSMADSRLFELESQNTGLKACLQSKDALINALRREANDEKQARLSTHSLLVTISGFPAEGQHWEDLTASLKLQRQNACEAPAGWQWLQAWDDDDGAAQPPEAAAAAHHSTTAALCFACVCLRHWMGHHARARDCLQSLVNRLESAAELPVGLCHTVLFAVLEAAGRRPLRFDIALLLCQVARLIAAKCHSERRREAAAKVRDCVSRDCADARLLDALLDSGGGGDLSDQVPFCTPTLAQKGLVVYVKSMDSLLFVSRERLRLRWISVRRIDWTKSSIDSIHLRSGDVGQKLRFGQVDVELFKALLHL
ncbi:hypothetical protein V2A60_004105 [Cordyceps javanica]